MDDSAATVDWASLIAALLIDAAVPWAPALAGLHYTPLQPTSPQPAAVAAACLGVGLVLNLCLYSRGSTLGTYLCGFRLRTRDGLRPGPKAGLVLMLLNLLTVLLVAVLVLLDSNSSTPLTADPGKYPIRAERTRPRRFLQAADAYWRRWSK